MPRSAVAMQATYVLAVALLPSIAFWAAFAVTCAIECSVLPWLSMIAGPGIAIFAIIIIGIVTYKKAVRFGERDRWRVRFTIISSLIWGWPIAYCIFGVTLPLAQKIGS
jgi:hypothetical protein